MEPEIKMYMLVSGRAVITHELKNESEVLWEYPMEIALQQVGMKQFTVGFNPLNIPEITKSQKAFPDISKVLYVMLPNEKIIEAYLRLVGELKMRASGIVPATPQQASKLHL